MKKIFLLSLAAGLSVSSFAQTAKVKTSVFNPKSSVRSDNPLNKSTAIGSVDTLSNLTGATGLGLYYAGYTVDSGYASGMDIYGDKGFAERYDFNHTDSTLQVIGMIYYFSGAVSPTSTNTVDFHAWSVGASAPIGTSTVYSYSGLPNTVLASASLPFTAVGVGPTADTAKIIMFTAPTAYLTTSFFVGCELNYTWSTAAAAGDTLGIQTSTDGDRTAALYTVSGADTIVNDVSVSEYSDGTWHDNAAENFQFQNDLALVALVKVGAPLSVNGIANKNLTFFGNYPNPAITSTNVKFSLANASNVTITVMDMSGRVINTMSQDNLSSGTHIINVETSDLAAGTYIYAIRSSNGGGIASEFTVIR